MFYDIIEHLCKERGIYVTQLASDIGVSKSNVTNWKNGSVPRSDKVRKIADYFGVTVDYLLRDTTHQISFLDQDTGNNIKKKLGGRLSDEQQKQYDELMELLEKVPEDKLEDVKAMLKALANE